MSGVAYLMVKSSDKSGHTEKKHLTEQTIWQSRPP
jgi:hypothetical protein